MPRLSPPRPLRIFLTGFSGTGKTLVAPIVAERLGWRFVDTDKLVEEAAGRPIPNIFRDEGEVRFRQMEAEALRQACAQEGVVVSTGGGAVLRPENRRLMAQGGFIVCLEARPETILGRLQQEGENEPLDRPLLAGPDPLTRIRELKAHRQRYYALADSTIHTDALSPEEAAQEAVRARQDISPALLVQPGRLEAFTAARSVTEVPPSHQPAGAACLVQTASASYPVFVSWGALFDLGGRLREAELAQQAYLISDDAVFLRYGPQAEQALRQAEIPVASFVVPAGEASKSLATAAGIYDWLVEQRAERGHAIVALGGGMITDLAGYVAATFARGLPLVHVPTSLVAMVDAAIGGKVAVNLPQAKNLIGAFYQPRLVLADVSTLHTLPPRELTSGWAEVIKHALIADEDLLQLLEEQTDAILRLEPELTTAVIQRSATIKAAIVAEDEREESGRRTVLNYGHTVGHGLEAAGEYAALLHGEAVAIGMTAAAEISRRLGLISEEVCRGQRRLLERFGLPTRAPDLDLARVREAMARDKKVRGKAIRWVLLKGVGRPVVRDGVPAAALDAALSQVLP
jgi:3-dehydroquinate synthase